MSNLVNKSNAFQSSVNEDTILVNKVEYFKGKYWGKLTEQEHQELMENAVGYSYAADKSLTRDDVRCAIFLKYDLVISGTIKNGEMIPYELSKIESISEQKARVLLGNVYNIPGYLQNMEFYNEMIAHNWKNIISLIKFPQFTPTHDNVKLIIRYYVEEYIPKVSKFLAEGLTTDKIHEEVHSFLLNWMGITAWCAEENIAHFAVKITVKLYDHFLNISNDTLKKTLFDLNNYWCNYCSLFGLSEYLKLNKPSKGFAYLVKQLLERDREMLPMNKCFLTQANSEFVFREKVVASQLITKVSGVGHLSPCLEIQPGEVGYISGVFEDCYMVDFLETKPCYVELEKRPSLTCNRGYVKVPKDAVCSYTDCLIKAVGLDKYNEIMNIEI